MSGPGACANRAGGNWGPSMLSLQHVLAGQSVASQEPATEKMKVKTSSHCCRRNGKSRRSISVDSLPAASPRSLPGYENRVSPYSDDSWQHAVGVPSNATLQPASMCSLPSTTHRPLHHEVKLRGSPNLDAHSQLQHRSQSQEPDSPGREASWSFSGFYHNVCEALSDTVSTADPTTPMEEDAASGHDAAAGAFILPSTLTRIRQPAHAPSNPTTMMALANVGVTLSVQDSDSDSDYDVLGAETMPARRKRSDYDVLGAETLPARRKLEPNALAHLEASLHRALEHANGQPLPPTAGMARARSDTESRPSVMYKYP